MSRQNLTALFNPQTVAFVGGSNLAPALRYHRDLGFAGETLVVNPKYGEIEGYPCIASIADLPVAPDLAFVAIPRAAAIESIAALRERGCRAVVCNAAGFAETGDEGVQLQARLVRAIGPMAALGPNSIGLVNLVDPMAAIMDQFGVSRPGCGVAIVSQGGGLLCDAVFADRGLAITHLVGCGNQAVTGAGECVAHLLEDDRVSAVGLSFEGLRDTAALRGAAARALTLGKPIVALKFGKSAAGARAALSHTASMIGAGAAWEALFDRLGIVVTQSESEFFETLKLFDAGQVPKGRRALVTAASGVTAVMLGDHLAAAGFDLPRPTGEREQRLRQLLPGIATPGNPQDITMAAWNDKDRQQAIYAALLDEGYDLALMVQNYPRAGMWDPAEYAAQLEAMAAACAGRDVATLQLAPLVDCFPAAARDHTRRLGLAAMQGLDECMAALSHAVAWRERRAELMQAGPAALADSEPHAAGTAGTSLPGPPLDEVAAKAMIAAAGVPVPAGCVGTPEEATAAATALGFPVAVKAVDARLAHKTDSGAVHTGLESEQAVADAIDAMRRQMAEKAPDIPLARVLVESMVDGAVAEVMASVSRDPCVGPVMMLAGGGVEAELWNDRTLLAAPFHRAEIARALDRLKVAARIRGWRGSVPGDMDALLDALEALAGFAAGAVEEVEINPILVTRRGVWAVDATLIPSAAAPDAPR